VERLSDSKHSNTPESNNCRESEIDDEPSHISMKPEYSAQRLAEIMPKLNFIMNGSNSGNKVYDKVEVILFEKLYKCMKYKYEDIIKVLNLYSEVSPPFSFRESSVQMKVRSYLEGTSKTTLTSRINL
jgi:hypothetical protein